MDFLPGVFCITSEFEMNRMKLAAVVLFAVFVSPFAFAQEPQKETPQTKVKDEKTACPLCGAEVIALRVVDASVIGGLDTDFLTRGAGEPKEDFMVVMCHRCCFALPIDEFVKPLTEDEKALMADKKEELRKLIPEGITELPQDQHRIPSWVKYLAAYKCYGWLKKPQVRRAKICLQGSWATRLYKERSGDSAEIFKEAVKEFHRKHGADIEAKTRNGMAFYEVDLYAASVFAKELEDGEWPASDAPLVECLIGGFLRGAGAHIAATEKFDKTIASDNATKVLKTIAAKQRMLCMMEGQFQADAINHYKLAIESGEITEKPVLANATYLVGELSRRVGKTEDALEWYGKVLKMEDIPKTLQKLCAQMKEMVESRKK
jgi:tetratricopeptide (TPR) repeat protein